MVVFPDIVQADAADEQKPEKDDWSKEPAHSVGAVVLHAEEADEYEGCHENDDVRVHAGSPHFNPSDGRQDCNGTGMSDERNSKAECDVSSTGDGRGEDAVADDHASADEDEKEKGCLVGLQPLLDVGRVRVLPQCRPAVRRQLLVRAVLVRNDFDASVAAQQGIQGQSAAFVCCM